MAEEDHELVPTDDVLDELEDILNELENAVELLGAALDGVRWSQTCFSFMRMARMPG